MTGETYVQLEIEGPAGQTVGFVEGFRMARWGEAAVWFAESEHVELEGFLDGLRSKLDLERHVILRKELGEKIRKALETSKNLKIRVAAMREIAYAQLEFTYEVFSREEAETIRSLVEHDIPDGVRLEDYETHETIDADAKGVELYGPVHDYILKGSGRFTGEVPGVIEMARRLTGHDFIKTGKVVLYYRS